MARHVEISRWIGIGLALALAIAPPQALGKTAEEELFTLEGCWRGKGPDGLAAEVAYRFDEKRATLMESIRLENAHPTFTLYRLNDGQLSARVFASKAGPTRRFTGSVVDGELHFRPPQPAEASRIESGLAMLRFRIRDLDHFELHREWRREGATESRPYRFRRVFEECDPRQRSDDW